MNFKLEYYNKIGFENFNDKSIFEKIRLLLANDVFYVDENDSENFNSSILSLNKNSLYPYETDNETISRLPYLKINIKIANEIEQIIFDELWKSKDVNSDFELIEDYKICLITSINSEHKEKIISEYLIKTARLISHTLKEDYPYFFNLNENIDEHQLFEKLNLYYNDLLLVDCYRNPDFPQKLIEDIMSFKMDIISHVAPCSPGNFRIYNTSIGFEFIHGLLRTLDFFKKELKNLKHINLTKKGALGSNYSVDNVVENKNRFPLVFKNAYNCELFLFTLSFELSPKPIIFSYYFDIFKTQKSLKKSVKISDYIDFVNNVYGLNEVRLRKNLSNTKENNLINELIKREKEFNRLILMKSND